MNAWALMLGLPLRLMSNSEASADISAEVSEVVNLAMRGLLDSATIHAFLICKGFVEKGSQVRSGRTFYRTTAFLDGPALDAHVRARNEALEFEEVLRRSAFDQGGPGQAAQGEAETADGRGYPFDHRDEDEDPEIEEAKTQSLVDADEEVKRQAVQKLKDEEEERQAAQQLQEDMDRIIAEEDISDPELREAAEWLWDGIP